MLDLIGELLYVITTPVLRLVEPFRNRRRSLFPNTHPAPLDNEWEYCHTCKEDTVHNAYAWRVEGVVTLECLWCGSVKEK